VIATDIRDAFFDEVCRRAEADRNVIVLSDDMGAMALDRLRQSRPDQFINLGIAEQNAIDLAAGMALGGLRPVVYGITNFVSLRCAEQISVSLSLMNLPVTIVGSGGGLTYSADGPTHQGTQDVGVLRTMPHMNVYNPADAASTAAAARLSLTAGGPCYVRIEKGTVPDLYCAEHDFSTGFSLLERGDEVLFVGTGYATHIARAAARLLRSQGVASGVLDLFRLKPIDFPSLGEALSSARRIAVIEEQCPTGGAFTIVAETLAEAGMVRPVKRLTLPDVPCFRYGSREWLHRQFELAPECIAEAIRQWTVRSVGQR